MSPLIVSITTSGLIGFAPPCYRVSADVGKNGKSQLTFTRAIYHSHYAHRSTAGREYASLSRQQYTTKFHEIALSPMSFRQRVIVRWIIR